MPQPIGHDVGWFLAAADARGIARALSAAVRRGAASEPLTVPKCPSFLRILSDQTFDQSAGFDSQGDARLFSLTRGYLQGGAHLGLVWGLQGRL